MTLTLQPTQAVIVSNVDPQTLEISQTHVSVRETYVFQLDLHLLRTNV